MANGDKIDYGKEAAARLAGVRADKLPKSRQDSHRAGEDEDWSPKGKPTAANAEEGWEHKGWNPAIKDKRFFKKAAEQARQERRETLHLPTAEECEALTNHQHYIWFKQGAWNTFLRETTALSLSEEEKREEFEAICQEYLAEDVKALVQRGNMQDWQEFVARGQARETATQVTEQTPEADAVEAKDAGGKDQKYFDGNYMRSFLNKFFRMDADEKEKTGIDSSMLFYFLEGRGNVTVTWPYNMNGRTVTQEQYLTEAKKLEKFFEDKERNEAKELKPKDHFTVQSGDIVMRVDLASPHPTIKGGWYTTMNISDSRGGFGGNQIFMEDDIRAFMSGAKPDINSVDEIFKRPSPHLIHALKPE